MKNLNLLLLFLLMTSSVSLSQQFDGSVNQPGTEVNPISVDIQKLPPFSEIFNKNITKERGALPEDRIRDYIPPSVIPMQSDNIMGPTIYVKGYAGPNQNGWYPADADIAAGPAHVMVVTNEQFHIYGRSGTLPLLSTNSLQTFFNRIGKSIFDPKVAYDPWKGRWIMLALESDGLLSYHWLAVSKTSDPTGQWWIYQFPAHIDGSTTTQNWADYPGLGFSAYGSSASDSSAIFITSNMYNQSGAFQYAKIRCIKAQQVYNGGSAGYYDFWGMTDANTTKSFTIKPACQWWSTSFGQEYLINTYGGSNNYITLWRIDHPLWWVANGISITRQSTITLSLPYSVPTSTKQPGGVVVDAFDCRAQDIIMSSGLNTSAQQKLYIYTALPSKYVFSQVDTNSVINYYKLNITDNIAEVQINFGNQGYWWTFPKVAPVYKSPYVGDTVFISVVLGGSALYNESVVTTYSRNGNIGSYLVVQAGGTGHYGNFRFGDYSGAVIDPLQNGNVWVNSMRNKSGGWGTGIGYVSNNPISGIEKYDELIPENFVLYQNYPNPFNPSTTITFSVHKSDYVSLKVFNSIGMEVATIVNTKLSAGNYKIDFDGRSLPSGIYFYRLSIGNFSDTKKMILVK